MPSSSRFHPAERLAFSLTLSNSDFNPNPRKDPMNINPISPMECLTAFAIVMVTAAITAIGLVEYIHALKRCKLRRAYQH